MRIGIVGYGRMGKEIERVSLLADHEITQLFTRSNPLREGSWRSSVDVLIDFSVADSALSNIEAACKMRVPLVIGTTGWNDGLEKAKGISEEFDGSVLFGANFSVGIAVLSRLAKYSTQLLKSFPEYSAAIHEIHHSAKLDAPSGTALAIRKEMEMTEVPISSSRVGKVPGTHSVIFDSELDTLELTHTARTRNAFASGAVRASEWLYGKSGFFTVNDMFEDVFRKEVE